MRLKKLIILIIILLSLLLSLMVYDVFINVNTVDENNKVNNNIKGLDKNNQGIDIVNLGSNKRGSVDIIGPIGNKNASVKIAYIIGIHPLESTVHNVLYDSLIAKSDSLNYCYYIYKIDVTTGADDYNTGRMNGQLLAKEFVVPDVISKDYDLVVDIHSNEGTKGGSYEETNFIFAPLNNPSSKSFAEEIIAKIPPLVYYFPNSQTSPEYVTIPIIEAGTPAIIYETYKYESIEVTKDYIYKLINVIDNLKFN